MPSPFHVDITNDDIRELPLLAFDGEIHVVEEEKDLKEAVHFLNNHPILGFDTEKKPTFHKGEYNPTAIIQLSTMEEAFLFRLNKVANVNPLFQLMENPSIQKLGISIGDDLRELKKLRKFNPTAFVDMNSIANELGVNHAGVRKLTAIFLNHRISKSQQTSNWENEVLTPGQQKYAATDAWICLKIHNELIRKGYIQ